MKLQVGVKVLIKNSRGDYLFLRRTKLLATDSGKTSWDIPGGRINPGERLVDALKREIREETGHNMESAPELIAAQDILVPTKDLHVVRLTYIASEDIPEINLSYQHDEYKWVELADIASVDVEPYLAEVLKNLQP